MSYQQKRLVYFIVVVMMILFGLASRVYSHFLPFVIAENAGDILWAMMVYFGFRYLLVQGNMHTSLWVSLLFCFCIEFSQLYQANWINLIRNTIIGGLILGKGYLTVDLFRYTSGIVIAFFFDKLFHACSVKNTKKQS
ncbi:DUF2809 domain-containing protein [Ornithinibacillus xuwenensis]|uniref:DUF2809 domain-containing protein n=1 Tax=Ornithinibacillus xuwenensis TaxID=3144668 RepID=A0ABU9XI16_9BACI